MRVAYRNTISKIDLVYSMYPAVVFKEAAMKAFSKVYEHMENNGMDITGPNFMLEIVEDIDRDVVEIFIYTTEKKFTGSSDNLFDAHKSSSKRWDEVNNLIHCFELFIQEVLNRDTSKKFLFSVFLDNGFEYSSAGIVGEAL